MCYRLAEELGSYKSSLEKKRQQSRKRCSQTEHDDNPRAKIQKLDGPPQLEGPAETMGSNKENPVSMGSQEREMREIEERIAEQQMITEQEMIAQQADQLDNSGEKLESTAETHQSDEVDKNRKMLRDEAENSTDLVPGASLSRAVNSQASEEPIENMDVKAGMQNKDSNERIVENSMIAQEAETPDNVMETEAEMSLHIVPGGPLVTAVRRQTIEAPTSSEKTETLKEPTLKDKVHELPQDVIVICPQSQEAVVPGTNMDSTSLADPMEFKQPVEHSATRNMHEMEQNNSSFKEDMRTETPVPGSQQSKNSLDELLDEGLPNHSLPFMNSQPSNQSLPFIMSSQPSNHSLSYMMASQPQYALHDPDVTPARLRPAATPQKSYLKPVESFEIQSTQPQYHLMQDTDSDSDQHERRENSIRPQNEVKTHFIGGHSRKYGSMLPRHESVQNSGHLSVANSVQGDPCNSNLGGSTPAQGYSKQTVAMETNEGQGIAMVTKQRSHSMETHPEYTADDQRVPGGSPPKPIQTQEEPESPTMYPKTPGMSVTIYYDLVHHLY